MADSVVPGTCTVRIAYVCQAYPPMISGGAVIVERLAHGMVRRGHVVLVLTTSASGRAYASGSANLRLSRLRSVPNPFRVGRRYVMLPRGALRRELSRFQPDILHAHEAMGIGLASVRVAYSAGVPVVLTVHALPGLISAHVPDYRGLRAAVEGAMWTYARWVARHCDRLVAPTVPITQLLHEELDKLPETIGSGVDPFLFRPTPTSSDEAENLRLEYGLDPDVPVILHVGRIDPEKRVELVVEAAARVMDVTPSQLLIAGDGVRRSVVQLRCDQLGISHRAHFAGYVPRESQLPGIYRLASLFITLSDVETQCLVALEALMSGVPVVAADTPVMREMLQNGVNGFLVPAGDVDAASQRILDLLQNPTRAREMGRAGRKWAKAHTPERMLNLHEELYRSLLVTAADPAEAAGCASSSYISSSPGCL